MSPHRAKLKSATSLRELAEENPPHIRLHSAGMVPCQAPLLPLSPAAFPLFQVMNQPDFFSQLPVGLNAVVGEFNWLSRSRELSRARTFRARFAAKL